MKTILIFAAAFVSFALAEQFSYEGYKVWTVTTKSDVQRDQLRLWQNNVDIDFWQEISNSGRPVSIMVAPSSQSSFVHFLNSSNIENSILIENVERSFQAERKEQILAKQASDRLKLRGSAPRIDFNRYLTHAEINEYVDYLGATFSSFVRVETIGTSYEGRPLRALTISAAGAGQITGARPVMLIDAGVHAREWLAPAATLYILHQIVENHAQHQAILNLVDFIVIPMVNPDGYEFSRTSQRLWRKTRSPVAGSTCVGVDGNRNYAHMWTFTNNPCSEIYPGTSAFSESETDAVRSIFERYHDHINIYISMHTYGSYILYPWGYELNNNIVNWPLHHEIGTVFAQAIQAATGRHYVVGNAAMELGSAFGASDDYAAFYHTEASFTFELPGGGLFGFDFPPSQLESAVTETWTGFIQVINFVATHSWSATTK